MPRGRALLVSAMNRSLAQVIANLSNKLGVYDPSLEGEDMPELNEPLLKSDF
ncbi:hypothetical protein GCM10016272_25580 [Psychrobacter glaciei]|uniref:Uncharacterized protein n=1 Tax=Psychrobacter glaciei TaxID=619771 RepID=A0ABQ3GV98_9GAMM|nr:hypothetical protein GCM10016272_25580 [Psychrobacter glaciei]